MSESFNSKSQFMSIRRIGAGLGGGAPQNFLGFAMSFSVSKNWLMTANGQCVLASIRPSHQCLKNNREIAEIICQITIKYLWRDIAPRAAKLFENAFKQPFFIFALFV
jgi:hypothetical protein